MSSCFTSKTRERSREGEKSDVLLESAEPYMEKKPAT